MNGCEITKVKDPEAVVNSLALSAFNFEIRFQIDGNGSCIYRL